MAIRLLVCFTLPVDDGVDVKMTMGVVQSGDAVLCLHFSANSDCLDSLHINMPYSTWVQRQAANVFLPALQFAEQERASSC